MTEIICTCITAIAGILVAYLSASIKRSNDRAEKRAILRQRENFLSMKMTDAILSLSIVTANRLLDLGEENNGNVAKAKEAAKDAAHEYQEFLQEVTAGQVGK